jgi:hypothetical protein
VVSGGTIHWRTRLITTRCPRQTCAALRVRTTGRIGVRTTGRIRITASPGTDRGGFCTTSAPAASEPNANSERADSKILWQKSKSHGLRPHGAYATTWGEDNTIITEDGSQMSRWSRLGAPLERPMVLLPERSATLPVYTRWPCTSSIFSTVRGAPH